MEYGEKKYGKDNWKKGQDIPFLCDCAMQHLTAFMDGEELDPESGVSHIGHIMANCMMIAYNIEKDKPYFLRLGYEETPLSWNDVSNLDKIVYAQTFDASMMIRLQSNQGVVPFEQWLKETYNIEK